MGNQAIIDKVMSQRDSAPQETTVEGIGTVKWLQLTIGDYDLVNKDLEALSSGVTPEMTSYARAYRRMKKADPGMKTKFGAMPEELIVPVSVDMLGKLGQLPKDFQSRFGTSEPSSSGGSKEESDTPKTSPTSQRPNTP